MTRTVLHTMFRAIVFVAVSVAFQQGWIHVSDDPLGTGLTAFATFAVLAGAWGAADGWFLDTSRDAGPVIGRIGVIWLGVSVLLGVGTALGNQLEGPSDWSLVLTDVLSGLPIYLVLVCGMAVFTGSVVALVRPRPSALPR